MSGFLYWLPQQSTVTEEWLIEHLPHVKRSGAHRSVVAGPDGKPGLIYTTGDTAKYSPDDQRWVPGPGGAYWVGVWTASIPTPDDLERKNIALQCYMTPLADGHEWAIPVAVNADGGTMLPAVFGVNENGEAVQDIVPAYRDFDAAARKLYDLREMGELDLVDDEWFPIAVCALSQTYHVAELELRMLGVVTTENFRQIALMVIDFPAVLRTMSAYQESLKKNEPVSTDDTLNTGNGEEGNDPVPTQT